MPAPVPPHLSLVVGAPDSLSHHGHSLLHHRSPRFRPGQHVNCLAVSLETVICSDAQMSQHCTTLHCCTYLNAQHCCQFSMHCCMILPAPVSQDISDPWSVDLHVGALAALWGRYRWGFWLALVSVPKLNIGYCLKFCCIHLGIGRSTG